MEIRIVYTVFFGFVALSVLTVVGLFLVFQFSGPSSTSSQSTSTPKTEVVIESLPEQTSEFVQESTISDELSPIAAAPADNILGAQDTSLTHTDFTDRLYPLINAYRQEQNLSSLQVFSALEVSAQAKLADMKQKKYWTHISPDGTAPWDFFITAGYDYLYAGENLAFSHNTPWDVFIHWQQSDAHRDELLKAEYAHMGLAVDCGYQEGSTQNCVTVLHLGKRR